MRNESPQNQQKPRSEVISPLSPRRDTVDDMTNHNTPTITLNVAARRWVNNVGYASYSWKTVTLDGEELAEELEYLPTHDEAAPVLDALRDAAQRVQGVTLYRGMSMNEEVHDYLYELEALAPVTHLHSWSTCPDTPYDFSNSRDVAVLLELTGDVTAVDIHSMSALDEGEWIVSDIRPTSVEVEWEDEETVRVRIVSAAAPDAEPKSTKITATDIETVAIENPDGFTWAPGRETPEAGYCVAHDGTDIAATPGESSAELAEWLEQYADSVAEGMYVGGWLNGDTGRYEIALTEIVDDRADAIALAQEHDQIAIWDLEACEEVQTGGSGGSALADDVPDAEPKSTKIDEVGYTHTDDQCDTVSDMTNHNTPTPTLAEAVKDWQHSQRHCGAARDRGPYATPETRTIYDSSETLESVSLYRGMQLTEASARRLLAEWEQDGYQVDYPHSWSECEYEAEKFSEGDHVSVLLEFEGEARGVMVDEAAPDNSYHEEEVILVDCDFIVIDATDIEEGCDGPEMRVTLAPRSRNAEPESTKITEELGDPRYADKAQLIYQWEVVTEEERRVYGYVLQLDRWARDGYEVSDIAEKLGPELGADLSHILDTVTGMLRSADTARQMVEEEEAGNPDQYERRMKRIQTQVGPLNIVRAAIIRAVADLV